LCHNLARCHGLTPFTTVSIQWRQQLPHESDGEIGVCATDGLNHAHQALYCDAEPARRHCLDKYFEVARRVLNLLVSRSDPVPSAFLL
jgi:hypothetical protein